MFRLLSVLLIVSLACVTAQASDDDSLSTVQSRHVIETPLPQLVDELSLKLPLQKPPSEIDQFGGLRSYKQSTNQFNRIPDQNPWVVVGVLAAVVVFLLVLNGVIDL